MPVAFAVLWKSQGQRGKRALHTAPHNCRCGWTGQEGRTAKAFQQLLTARRI